MSSIPEGRLRATIEARAVAIAVYETACEDMSNGCLSDLGPQLATHMPWTSVFTESECRSLIGAVMKASGHDSKDRVPTELIDEVGWWRAKALGRGACVAHVLR